MAEDTTTQTSADTSNDDIVNSVLNEAFGTSTGTQDAQSATDKAVDAQAQGGNANTPVDGNVSPTGAGTPENKQPPTQPNAQAQDPSQVTRPGRVKDDGQGNLVDAQGNLVARRGPERRWYNEARAAADRVQQTQQELEALRGKVEPYEKAFATFANLQMAPQDIAIGAQLFKSFRTNPAATIEYLMTEARKNGVQIEGLGGSVDTAAIKATVMEALSPILQDRAQAQQLREADSAADHEYEEFVNDPDYQFARVHENELVAVMKLYPNYSMQQAYMKLENEALKNGLDFSQPLAPQWNAKRNANGAGNPNPAPVNTGRQPSVPLPSARASGGADVVNAPRIASASASSADIVRQTLREFGM